MNSHAQLPTAILLADRIRVYFASRPQQDFSLTGFVDLDPHHPERILGLSERPILYAGRPGAFDEHGIMPASVVRDGDAIRLYYTGWSRSAGKAPYHNATGVAVSTDGGVTFRKLFMGPVLDRTPEEPFSATLPNVIRRADAWHAHYCSGLGWLDIDGKMEHIYDLRHATSRDGIHWRRTGEVTIAQAHAEEAITRPTLTQRSDGEWWMWFCYRESRAFRSGSSGYRIGFAISSDLARWERRDSEAGIDRSSDGWDSQMIAYPWVVQTPAGLVMFYNGNAFGRDGIGWAIWEE
jgi:hypothetical protein